MFISILHVKHSNGRTMRLIGIDINPMKPYEFIVNGEDKYIRMYDVRNTSQMPVKIFSRSPTIRIVSQFILNMYTYRISQMVVN